jgi:hypothetical protein
VFLGTAIAAGTGALVGGLIGLISGATSHNKNTQTQAQIEEQKRIQAIRNAQIEERNAQIEEQRRYLAIRNAPVLRNHGSHVLETIANDPDHKRLMKEGTFEEVNNHIRDLVIHNSERMADFNGVKQGYDLYPVLLPDGTWRSQHWDDPLPTSNTHTRIITETNVQDRPATRTPVFSNHPYLNTANTHIEPAAAAVEAASAAAATAAAPSSFTTTPTTTPGV